MVLRLILISAAVAATTAAGFVTANSPAATQACRLASVGKLHGHLSMSVHETATGLVPGTTRSEVVSLSRQASNVSVQLKKKKLRIPGWTGYYGYSQGGSFNVADSFDNGSGGTGTLTGKGAPKRLGAVLAASPGGGCGYELGVTFALKTTFSGSISLSVSPSVSDFIITPSRKVPSSGKLAGSATVRLEPTGCALIYSPGGCVMYSGGWSNDFTMFKRCGTTSAGKCPSDDETDFGEAQINWNISPG
jgi:hypothetical protein